MGDLEGANFFIDECLSPTLAQRLCERGVNAIHPLQVGWRGKRGDIVLQRCIDEDRIIVTENAGDFRKLVSRIAMHPGLVILPSIDREGTCGLWSSCFGNLKSKGIGATTCSIAFLKSARTEAFTPLTYRCPRPGMVGRRFFCVGPASMAE